MAAIDVRIIGLEALQAGVAAGPVTLATEVRTAMVAGSLLMEGTARTLAPKDTGRLAGSITHTISGSGASLESRIGPSVQYGIFVEKGRAAGTPPPVSAVRGWASRHGMNPYALARSIGRRGIRPRPYMEPAFLSNVGRVIALFERIPGLTVRRMGG